MTKQELFKKYIRMESWTIHHSNLKSQSVLHKNLQEEQGGLNYNGR